jgi:hypothetical protein
MNDGLLQLLQPIHLLVLVFLLGFGLLMAVAWWRIVARTGHSGVIGLLMWVPLLNMVLLLWLAFSEWPIERCVQPAQPPNFCPNCGTALLRS